MPRRGRTTIAWAAKILVMIALLVLLAHLVNIRALVRLVGSANVALLGVGVVVALADRAVMIGKWYPLLHAQVPSIPFWRAARAYLASSFAALVLPTSVGGDMLRAIALGRGRSAVMEVGASIVAERLLGMVASGVPTLIALVLAYRSSVSLDILLPWALASLAVAGLALLFLMNGWSVSLLDRFLGRYRDGTWLRFVNRFAVAYTAYRQSPRTLVVVGALSVLEQGFPILVTWVVTLALGIPVSLRLLFVAVPLMMFVARLPLTIAAIGVGEGAMVYILGLFGVPAVDALALALTARVPDLVSLLPGAVLWYELVGESKKTPQGRGADDRAGVGPGEPATTRMMADGPAVTPSAPPLD